MGVVRNKNNVTVVLMVCGANTLPFMGLMRAATAAQLGHLVVKFSIPARSGVWLHVKINTFYTVPTLMKTGIEAGSDLVEGRCRISVDLLDEGTSSWRS